MDRVKTYAALEEITSADLNSIQDNAAPFVGLVGLCFGRPDLQCTDGQSITVGGRGVLCVLDAGAPALSLGQELSQSITPAGLVTATWYYLYGYLDAGNQALEVSTDGPDFGLAYKSTLSAPDLGDYGDLSRVYLGCFPTYTNGSSQVRIVPFTARNGRYRFHVSKLDSISRVRVLGDTSFTAGAQSGAGGFVDVSPAPGGSGTKLVPPHARSALLRAIAVNRHTGPVATNTLLDFRTKASDAGVDFELMSSFESASPAASIWAEALFELPLEPSTQQFAYRTQRDGGGDETEAWVDVFGFEE